MAQTHMNGITVLNITPARELKNVRSRMRTTIGRRAEQILLRDDVKGCRFQVTWNKRRIDVILVTCYEWNNAGAVGGFKFVAQIEFPSGPLKFTFLAVPCSLPMESREEREIVTCTLMEMMRTDIMDN